MNIVHIDADDARAWGRTAFGMGLTLREARDSITYCGCPARLLSLVTETYNHMRLSARCEERDS